MIWLGIDPGPSRCGWALVEVGGGRPPRFVDGGHAPAEEVLRHLERASRVALEWLAPGLFERKRHDGLIGTARVEGGLDWSLRQAGAQVTKLTAGQWRSDVVGRASPSDEEIAQVLRTRVAGLPVPPAVSASQLVHVIDAVGVALAGSYQPGEQAKLALGRGKR